MPVWIVLRLFFKVIECPWKTYNYNDITERRMRAFYLTSNRGNEPAVAWGFSLFDLLQPFLNDTGEFSSYLGTHFWGFDRLHNFQEEWSVRALIHSFKAHLLRPRAKPWRWLRPSPCLKEPSGGRQPYTDGLSSIIFYAFFDGDIWLVSSLWGIKIKAGVVWGPLMRKDAIKNLQSTGSQGISDSF